MTTAEREQHVKMTVRQHWADMSDEEFERSYAEWKAEEEREIADAVFQDQCKERRKAMETPMVESWKKTIDVDKALKKAARLISKTGYVLLFLSLSTVVLSFFVGVPAFLYYSALSVPIGLSSVFILGSVFRKKLKAFNEKMDKENPLPDEIEFTILTTGATE